MHDYSQFTPITSLISINQLVLVMETQYVICEVKVKVKVKVTLEQATKVQRCSSTLFLTSALDVIGLSTLRPGRFTPMKDPVPIV